jgi:hypothetical protein
MLPFDHRESFATKLFGWTGALTEAQAAEITDAKRLIYDMANHATSAAQPRATSPLGARPAHEQIEQRAYYRYLERGRTDGQALEDWLTAEAELRQASTTRPAS